MSGVHVVGGPRVAGLGGVAADPTCCVWVGGPLLSEFLCVTLVGAGVVGSVAVAGAFCFVDGCAGWASGAGGEGATPEAGSLAHWSVSWMVVGVVLLVVGWGWLRHPHSGQRR